MKRESFIYERICDIENIKRAIHNAAKKKKKRLMVKTILNDEEYYAQQIRKMLLNKTFRPTKPIQTKIFDGNNRKHRIIYKPKFYPDQIIHWALMQQIDSILLKSMYGYSCGSIPGRGTGFARKTINKWIRKDKINTKYCLKLDVTKFYPSVNCKKLNEMIATKIKDEDCLSLIKLIIGNDKNLPIGFYTSQWFSNYYLTGLDHLIKQELKVKYYIRYVDDLVLFGPNKKKLHKSRVEIERELNKLDLKLKDNWQVFRLDKRDLDFLGFRFYRNRTTLRKSNYLRMRRRVTKIKKKGYLNEVDAKAILSYWGWIKHSNSYSFYKRDIKPVVPIKLARKVVSDCAKIRNSGRRPINYKLSLSGRLQTCHLQRGSDIQPRNSVCRRKTASRQR